MQDVTMTSAGIDIGTTTTQLTVSRLTLRNTMPGSYIPRIEVAEIEVLYCSQMHFTPIIDHARVDTYKLKKLLESEYDRAGISSDQIETGAVIITGETAKKENAELILHMMSELAGDFVVAVAGPDIESAIAGKGSGALEYSKRTHGRIINLDIGGGTTNIAVFNDGKLEETACLNVGGRLIEVCPESGRVQYVSEVCDALLQVHDISLSQGISAYEKLCEAMVTFVDDCVLHRKLNAIGRTFLMTEPLKSACTLARKRDGVPVYDGVMFSGGVAECFYDQSTWDQPFKHGDLGPILADAFRRSELARTFHVIEPKEKIRATVIGAGNNTIDVSGSTIQTEWMTLPVKNIPVAVVVLSLDDLNQTCAEQRLGQAFNRFKEYAGNQALGLSISIDTMPKYSEIQLLAKALFFSWHRQSACETPLVILLEHDFGKALGQALRGMTTSQARFACIDSVHVKDGDYIDIGKPVYEGGAVILVVKTLVFQSGGS